jgi:1-phosphofructokinase
MEPRGAGDSLTAGMTACLAKGDPSETALRIGAACGALNVVRHGLGTGGATAVEILARAGSGFPRSTRTGDRGSHSIV